jgi:ubiquinone/menaquinone biosynthesis C-methylase UbiE
MSSISFDPIADQYDATRGGLRRGRHAAAALAPWIAGTRIVEVGIGTGAVAAGLREHGHRPVGVDLSSAMLARALDRLGPVVARADGYRLPLADGAVDTVYLVWVLQLVPDQLSFLRECGRVIRSGGRVIVIPSHQDTVDDDVELIAGPLHGLLRPNRCDATAVEAWAESAGLRVVATDRTAEDVYDRSPNDEAGRLEQRTYSSMWSLTDDEYARIVAPVVAALRGLPEPSRPRTRRSHCAVVVMERP